MANPPATNGFLCLYEGQRSGVSHVNVFNVRAFGFSIEAFGSGSWYTTGSWAATSA